MWGEGLREGGSGYQDGFSIVPVPSFIFIFLLLWSFLTIVILLHSLSFSFFSSPLSFCFSYPHPPYSTKQFLPYRYQSQNEISSFIRCCATRLPLILSTKASVLRTFCSIYSRSTSASKASRNTYRWICLLSSQAAR